MNGEPIFIDSGTYTYNGNLKWRSYFRGIEAHNVAEVKSLEQARPIGIFGWSGAVEGKLLKWKETNNYVEFIGEYSKYVAQYKFVNTYQRRIVYDKIKNEWSIEDNLNISNDDRPIWFFHLASGSEVSLREERCWIKKGDIELKLLWEGNESIEAKIKDSWVSPSYGQKISNKLLCVQCREAMKNLKFSIKT